MKNQMAKSSFYKNLFAVLFFFTVAICLISVGHIHRDAQVHTNCQTCFIQAITGTALLALGTFAISRGLPSFFKVSNSILAKHLPRPLCAYFLRAPPEKIFAI